MTDSISLANMTQRAASIQTQSLDTYQETKTTAPLSSANSLRANNAFGNMDRPAAQSASGGNSGGNPLAALFGGAGGGAAGGLGGMLQGLFGGAGGGAAGGLGGMLQGILGSMGPLGGLLSMGMQMMGGPEGMMNLLGSLMQPAGATNTNTSNTDNDSTDTSNTNTSNTDNNSSQSLPTFGELVRDGAISQDMATAITDIASETQSTPDEVINEIRSSITDFLNENNGAGTTNNNTAQNSTGNAAPRTGEGASNASAEAVAIAYDPNTNTLSISHARAEGPNASAAAVAQVGENGAVAGATAQAEGNQATEGANTNNQTEATNTDNQAEATEEGDNEGEKQDPLAFDLNGDNRIGVTGETTAKDSRAGTQTGNTVNFDLNSDGVAEETEWLSGDGDGFLVDNRDGMAAQNMNGSRLFGDQSGQFSDGYQQLSQLDANNDGRLAGAELEGLDMWVDNGDGQVQQGEFKSLAELGITEISTQRNDVQNSRGETLMQSSATRNGEQILTEDVWFAQG